MVAEPDIDYRLLFEKSSGLYVVFDPAIRIVAASDDFCRTAHQQRDALLGRDVSGLYADPGVQQLVRASLECALATRRPDAIATFLSYVVADGGAPEERHWNALNVPVVDDGGVVRWIIHRIHDVTRSVLDPQSERARVNLAREQDHIIQRLRTTNDELAQLDGLRQGLEEMSRLNTISLMASALAHDVSQPLTAARNYLSALRRSWRSTDEAQVEDVLTKIGTQIDRAGEIVKGLRRLMSADTTVHKLENVAAMIGAAAKLSRSSFDAAEANLVLDVAGDLGAMAADRVQILQLLVCLLENAAEATEGAPVREVVLEARRSGNILRISVSDTGVGLPDEIATMLADPFAATRLIGSGLGLPIARQVLKMHEGTMRVTPNAPRGTVFSLELPYRELALARDRA
jgi:two-component system sensor kinase FixL